MCELPETSRKITFLLKHEAMARHMSTEWKKAEDQI